jgi:hypothetical protein
LWLAKKLTAKEIDMIQVRRAAESDSFVFEVVVREGNGETHHHVTMSEEMCERLTSGKHTPERCAAISRYFPEFEREIPHYLSQS